MPINEIKLVEYAREKYPYLYGGLDDETIVRMTKEKYPDWDWSEKPSLEVVEPPKETQSPDDIDTPGLLSSVLSWSATDNLAQDYDWAKKAYNNSVAGAMYQIAHGKPKYEVDDVPMEAWQEVAGFFLGMTNPVEAATFIAGGGFGGVAGKMAANKFFKESAINGLKKAAIRKSKDKAVSSFLMKQGALESGLSLGTYSAANSAIHSYGQQSSEIGRGERKDFDHFEVAKHAAEAGLHSSVLGAMGGIVKAPMSKNFAKASKQVEALKGRGVDIPSSLVAKKILNSEYGQILAEANIFTAGHLAEQAIMSGEVPSMEDWWKGIFTNTAIIGGLKGGSKLVNKALGKDLGAVERYDKAVKSIYGEAFGNRIPYKEWKALQGVEKNLKENNVSIPSEIAERLATFEIEASDRASEFKNVKSNIKNLNKLREKATDSEGNLDLNRLTDVEKGAFGELSTSLNLWMIDFYDTLSNNKEIAYEMYRSELGKKELTKTDKLFVDRNIKSKLNEHMDVSDLYNELVTGRTKSSVPVELREKPPTEIKPKSDLKEKLGLEKETEISIDKDLPFGERLSQLEKAGLEKGMSLEEINQFKGKSKIATKENPQAWDIDGLESAVKGFKRVGVSEGADVTVDYIKDVNRRKPYETLENEKYKKKLDNANIPDESKNIISDIVSNEQWKLDSIAEGTKSKHLNQIVKFSKWLKSDKDGFSLFGEGNKQIDNIAEYISGMTSNQKHAALDAFSKFYSQREAYRHIENGADLSLTVSNRSKMLGVKAKLPGKRTQLLEPKEGMNFSEQMDAVREKIKSSKKEYDTSKKGDKIGNKETDLLLDIMEETAVRPEDFSNIRIIENRNELRWQERKKSNRKEAVTREVSPRLYNKIIEYMDSKGYTVDDALILSKKGKTLRANDINKIVRNTMKDSGEVIMAYERATGKKTPMEKNPTGLQEGRIFRTREAEEIFGGDTNQLAAFSQKLQHGSTETTRRSYVPPILKSSKARMEGRQKLAERLPEEIRFKEGDAKARESFVKEVMSKNNLNESQLKEVGLDKNVLGEWANGIIKLQKGEWQPADFFHENLHRLKDWSKLTNNSKLNKMISQAEKLGKQSKEYKEWKKNNKGRDIEEFLADVVGGKADKIQFTKGVLPKLKQIVNQIVSRLKTSFGMGNFKDYSNVLAKQVQKGFETGDVKFGKGVKQRIVGEIPTEEIRTISRSVNKKLMDKLESIDAKFDKDKMTNYIAELAGIDASNYKNKSFSIMPKKGVPDGVPASEHYQNLKTFEAVFNSLSLEKIKRAKDVNKWFETYKQVDVIRVHDKNITDAKQKEYLLKLGVPQGDIWKSSQAQLNDYKILLSNIRTQKLTGDKFVDGEYMNHQVDPQYLSFYGKATKELGKVVLPVYKVFEGMGLKPLSKKMKDHFGIEAGHLGAYDTFVQRATEIAGGTNKWLKMKDSVFGLSGRGERFLENLEALKEFKGDLSPKEIKRIKNMESFFKKAVHKEWFKKGGDLKKFINKDTKEGKVAEAYIEFMKHYSSSLDKVLRITMNEAQYERFMKEGNIKMIEDGIYVTQQTTNQFKKLVGMESKAINKLIDESTNTIALKLAKEEFKTKNPTNEMISSKMEEAKGMAYENLYDASNFSLDKISSKFLLKRKIKLPEFVKNPDTGKLIRVYETSHEATALKYAIGMSKFLATLEKFPEFANIKGMKSSGAKALIGEVKKLDPQAFEWVNDSFEKRIGVGQSNPFEITTGFTQKYANVLAKVGLSAPTSGFKNIITGTAGTTYAFELTDMARGFSDILKGNAKRLSKTGLHQIGTGHFEQGKAIEFLDKSFFKWGLMKPTEKFNRNLATLASQYDIRRMVDMVKNNKKGSPKYERANDRLKDFYELSKQEVDLMKKYGFEPNNVERSDFSTAREFIIEQRNLENAVQKSNTMAHVKTQGASIDLFMPHWASGNMIRPLTLYKRMAFAATANTAENITRAYKGKNWGKLLAGSLATYAGGSVLMGVYSQLLGQPMPKENSDWWRKTATILWKGEFLGILSEFFSPYQSSINNSLYPAVYNNMGALMTSFNDVISGKKRVFGKGQAFDTYARKTVNIYNTMQKVIERRTNPYNRDMIRMKKLWKDYEEEVYETPSVALEGNELTKYKIDLRNAFNLGTDEEFVKTYATLQFAIAADYLNKGFIEGANGEIIKRVNGNVDLAFKEANTRLKQMITNLNPNPATIRKKQKLKTKIKKIGFYDWILEKDPQDKRQLVSRMNELEKEYNDRIKRLNKTFGYHARKMNLKELAKEFNL